MKRRFTKSLHDLKSRSSIDRLKEFALETLKLRRLKQDLVMWFKIINGDVETDPLSFFTFSTNCIIQEATSTSYISSLCV